MTSQPSVYTRTTLFDRQVAWLYKLVSEGQLLADLAFADIVIWAPTQTGSFVAVSHLRPSSAATLFYRDVVESEIRPEWLSLVSKAYEEETILDSQGSDRLEEGRTKVRAVPIRMTEKASGDREANPIIAVLTRHSNLRDSRVPSRQELTFDECANDLFAMISEGSFPDPDAPSAPAQGAPRASDGLIKLDVGAKVTFASPTLFPPFDDGFSESLRAPS